MGIRINKRLGYGFVTPRDAAISTTDRLNLDSFLVDSDKNPFETREEMLADYLAFSQQWEEEQKSKGNDFAVLLDAYFLERNKGENGHVNMGLYALTARSEEPWNDESEARGQDIFVLTPFGMLNEWYRFDSMIDYIEDMNISKNYSTQEEVRVLRDGIWPYSASYIRMDTKERITNPLIMQWMRLRNAEEEQEIKSNDFSVLDEFAQMIGFASHEEADRLVRAKPSDDAVVLALWGKVFKNPEDAYLMDSVYWKYWR